MAFEDDVLDVSMLVAANSTPALPVQYSFVKITADNTVAMCNAAADKPFGIIQNAPTVAGQVARVRVMGVSRVITGAAGLLRNTTVGTDAAGKAIAKSTDKDYYLGIATAASSANELGTVVLTPTKMVNV